MAFLTRQRAIRLLISVVLMSALGFGAYAYLSAKASGRVLAQMLKMAEMMELPAGEKAEVRRLIENVHQGAFDASLHLTAETGKQFDQQRYFDRVFTDMIAAARSEGRTTLADTIQMERGKFSFDAAEP